jgi:DNA/RNA-binding domain of Phe-tRNA-synthetase-like protein
MQDEQTRAITTPPFPPETSSELEGWTLVWFRLLPSGGGEAELDELRREVAAQARERFADAAVTDDPAVAGMRKLFREAGTDPTRYRPSSEALLRRILKGDDLPAIHPLVDLNNLLSLSLIVPCCVVDPRRVEPPFAFRRGREGESMESMRGPFGLQDRPLLADAQGPFGTPITDSERVMVRENTGEVWLVTYLPEAVGADLAAETLRSLLSQAPVAELAD